jgi:hypothetical protein
MVIWGYLGGFVCRSGGVCLELGGGWRGEYSETFAVQSPSNLG